MVTFLAEKALAVVLGIETVAGKGPTGRAGRAALKTGARAILAGTTVIAPPIARAAAFTPTGRALLGAGAVGAAYQGGYFDPAIQRAQEESFRAQENLRRFAMESDVQRAYETAGRPTFGEAAQQLVSVPKKRSVSKFNRAMKAGMSAVRKSKSNGKPGKLSKPKATFGRVAKVYKALSSGRKVSTKGETGVIQRNIKRFIG
jgi:hypothetical protein